VLSNLIILGALTCNSGTHERSGGGGHTSCGSGNCEAHVMGTVARGTVVVDTQGSSIGGG
jgi:hypothetical protein